MADDAQATRIAELERRIEALDDARQTLKREFVAFKEKHGCEVSNLVAQLSLMRTLNHNQLVALSDRVVALESAVWEGIPKGANDDPPYPHRRVPHR
jgi:hypothetical protein